MNIKTITFIKAGEEPERTRKSKYAPLIEAVRSKLPEITGNKSMTIGLEGKSYQPFMRALRDSVDDSQYEVYRVKDEVVIKRLEQSKAKK